MASSLLWLQRLCRLHCVPPDALWDSGMFVCLCASQKFLNVTIRYLSYAVGFLPHFSPHYILYIICVDSGDAWSGRCLIECVIYAKEVTPNLFQRAGNPQHTNAQITTDLHIHTDVLWLRFSLYCIHRITHSDSMSKKKKKTLAGSEKQFPKYGQELRSEGNKLGACVWGGAMMKSDGQFWNALGSVLKII